MMMTKYFFFSCKLAIIFVSISFYGCAGGNYDILKQAEMGASIEVDTDSNGDVDVAFGGTNGSTAAAARTNLGLVIGTDVLAPDGDGSALTGLTPTNITPVDTGDEDATFYPVLVDGTTGTQATETDGELTYNPSTGVFTIPTLSVTDYGLIAGDIPDISATYETQLSNSAGLAAAISDETGTEYSVFSDSPTLTTQISLTGAVPRIFITDTDTGSDAVIDGASSNGSLYLKADNNDEVAGSHVYFFVDGAEVANIDDSSTFTLGGNAITAAIAAYLANVDDEIVLDSDIGVTVAADSVITDTLGSDLDTQAELRQAAAFIKQDLTPGDEDVITPTAGYSEVRMYATASVDDCDITFSETGAVDGNKYLFVNEGSNTIRIAFASANFEHDCGSGFSLLLEINDSVTFQYQADRYVVIDNNTSTVCFSSIDMEGGAFAADDANVDSVTPDAATLVVGDYDEETHVQADGIPDADDTYSCGMVVWFTAGDEVAQWDLVAMQTDGYVDQANASMNTVLGYAVETSDTWPATTETDQVGVCLLGSGGVIRNDGWADHTAGEIVYVVDAGGTDGFFDPADEIDLEDGDYWIPVGIMQEEDVVVFPAPAFVTDDGT